MVPLEWLRTRLPECSGPVEPRMTKRAGSRTGSAGSARSLRAALHQARDRRRTQADQRRGDGGQMGLDQRRVDDVVEADDAHIAGHRPAGGRHRLDESDGHQVVVGDHSGRRLEHPLLGRGGAAANRRQERADASNLHVQLQTRLPQAPPAGTVDPGSLGSREIADRAYDPSRSGARSPVLIALHVVDDDRGDLADDPIQQHDRHPFGERADGGIRHPGRTEDRAVNLRDQPIQRRSLGRLGFLGLQQRAR